MYIYLHQAEDNLFVSPWERMLTIGENGKKKKNILNVNSFNLENNEEYFN